MTDGEQTYDVVVLGAGSTGENVADIVLKGGLSAVVVEAELVGGECSYWACMPSKALLRGTRVLDAARAVDGARQAVMGEQDVAATLARRDTFTHGWDDASQVEWLEGAGIDLVRGAGRLAGERTVVVTTDDGEVRLTARHAVAVCTGSEAAVPPVEGLDRTDAWTPRDATSAKEARAGCWCSAAATSAARWRRPGRRWARRSRSASAGSGCSRASSPPPGRR